MNVLYVFSMFLLIGLVNSKLNNSKMNPFLDRKRRYLSFPKGSNFVINLTLVKPFLQSFPAINFLLECDVPFVLPSKGDYIREKYGKTSPYIPLHFRQRRKVFSQLEDAFTVLGLDGNSCLQRFLCEVELFPLRGNFLVIDMLRVIFDLKDFNKYYGDYFENKCAKRMFEKCKVSFLDLFLRILATH